MIERQLFWWGSPNLSKGNYHSCNFSVTEDIRGARGLGMDFSLKHSIQNIEFVDLIILYLLYGIAK